MKNPYIDFVEAFRTARLSVMDAPSPQKTPVVESERKVLLFSPHPDDEIVTGLLPLRLMREAGAQIINVPVTFGSNPLRRAARAEELKAACGYLGFQTLEETGRLPQRGFQNLEKETIVELLIAFRPVAIFVPHAEDWNSRHESTHHLVMNALSAMPAEFSCFVVETEFWRPMKNPNWMVEADTPMLADLIAALALHAGEVARNPYHLSLPAWMMDNVRRGGEVVLGQGGTPPAFAFATLYRLRRWADGKFSQSLENGKALGCHENASAVLA
jgi:LmbE family N-acetylglucosaminyl deacetylase